MCLIYICIYVPSYMPCAYVHDLPKTKKDIQMGFNRQSLNFTNKLMVNLIMKIIETPDLRLA